MSTRERWIVYPLLFLTLGAVLRDKLVGSRELRAEHVVCDRLESLQCECRGLVVLGPNGRPVVLAGTDSKSRSGALATFSPEGIVLVQLDSSPAGGTILLTGVGQGFGVFAQSPKQGIVPIAVPHWPEAKSPGKQPEKKAAKVPSITDQPAKKPTGSDGTKGETNNRKTGETRTNARPSP